MRYDDDHHTPHKHPKKKRIRERAMMTTEKEELKIIQICVKGKAKEQ